MLAGHFAAFNGILNAALDDVPIQLAAAALLGHLAPDLAVLRVGFFAGEHAALDGPLDAPPDAFPSGSSRVAVVGLSHSPTHLTQSPTDAFFGSFARLDHGLHLGVGLTLSYGGACFRR